MLGTRDGQQHKEIKSNHTKDGNSSLARHLPELPLVQVSHIVSLGANCQTTSI